MLDTGAQPNIIKKGCLKENGDIDIKDIIKLTGITEEVVETLGSIQAHIDQIPITFHIVENDFPIITQGILGSTFFTNNHACINYGKKEITWKNNALPFKQRESVVVPPRIKTGLTIRVTNPEVKVGYLPRMQPCKGAYAGDCLVTCINDKAYIPIVNTLDHEIEIIIPTITLLEVEKISKTNNSTTEQIESKKLQTQEPVNELNNSFKNLSIQNASNTQSYSLINQASVQGQEPCLPYDASRCIVDQGRHSLSSNSFISTKSSTYSRTGSPNSNSKSYPRAGSSSSPRNDIPVQLSTESLTNEYSTNSMSLNDKASSSSTTNSHTDNYYHKNNNCGSQKERVPTIIGMLRLEHLNLIEKENIISLVKNYQDRFYLPNEYLGRTSVISHKIITSDNTPINTKQYRFPPMLRQEIHDQVNQLLKKEIVQTSTSPYNSPVWIVPKKPDSAGNKRWRMVIDYRRLNEKTIADAYPLPNICDILDQLGGAKYFSILDLANGFHQIPMDDNDAYKTAFSTPHGHYEFTRMPFGLKNAPATFQRLMDQILTGLQGNELFVYMDDIVIYASSLREHDIKIAKLMARLRSANLTLQVDKCEFLRHEVAYLGHIIGENGVRPDPQKIIAVKNFPAPRNQKGIRQFLGLAGYYRRFIQDFSKIASPLSNMLKKNATFHWNTEAQEAFNLLRELLCEEPILQFPDFKREFILTTDASNYAIGGVLSQGILGQDLPISYASRIMNSAEKNYSTIEKELLAITYCVNHFRPYLYGRRFTLVTDHQPLVWLHKIKDPTSRLMRWRLKLEEYDYQVIYKTGLSNKNADALSRNPTTEIAHLSLYPIIKKLRLNDNRIWTVVEDNDDNDNSRPRKSARTLIIPVNDPEETIISSHDLISSPSPILTESIPSCSYNLRPRKRVNCEELPSEEEELRFREPIDIIEIDEGPELWTHSDPVIPDHPSSDDDEESINEESIDMEPEFVSTHSLSNLIKKSYTPLLEKDDNLVIMVTTDAHPIDNGAREMQKEGKLPPLDNLMLGRARVYPLERANRHIIALPIKERTRTSLDSQILRECFLSLLDVMTKLILHSISLRHTDNIDTLSWEQIHTLLEDIAKDRPMTITICYGATITPSPQQRPAIIKEHHESTTGGHKGITKTYLRIKQRYTWRNMKQDTQEFIRNCRQCQVQKLVRKKTRQPMILTDTPGRAFDKVALDILGPFKRTPQGNSYVLTMQDLLTKYSIYAPIGDLTAETTATAFINSFICRFGCPRSILTDQGTNFVSLLFKSITRKFRIQHFRTTSHHPQSNGSLERSHIVLTEYLKCFVIRKENWDELINQANFSYNTAVHEGTGYTPHELIFGTQARVPSSFRYEDELETYHSYLSDVFKNIHDLQETARTNLMRAKKRSKTYYDRRINPETFHTGEYVLLTNNYKTNKFSAEYLGPYLVIESLSHGNVRIKIGNTTRIVHSNRLKKCAYDEPG